MKLYTSAASLYRGLSVYCDRSLAGLDRLFSAVLLDSANDRIDRLQAACNVPVRCDVVRCRVLAQCNHCALPIVDRGDNREIITNRADGDGNGGPSTLFPSLSASTLSNPPPPLGINVRGGGATKFPARGIALSLDLLLRRKLPRPPVSGGSNAALCVARTRL